MKTKLKMKKRARQHLGGRPPKFNEPRRVVTVTLPERTLRHLATVEPDLAHAVVKVTEASLAGGQASRPVVEIVQVAPGTSVILVAPSRCLRAIPWLRMIEITPARFLLTIVPGTAIESLEITILDQLEGLPKDEDYERQILTELRRVIQALRRDRAIWKAELLFIGGAKHRFPI